MPSDRIWQTGHKIVTSVYEFEPAQYQELGFVFCAGTMSRTQFMYLHQTRTMVQNWKPSFPICAEPNPGAKLKTKFSNLCQVQMNRLKC